MGGGGGMKFFSGELGLIKILLSGGGNRGGGGPGFGNILSGIGGLIGGGGQVSYSHFEFCANFENMAFMTLLSNETLESFCF